MKYIIYEETREVFVKSLELLYQGDIDFCKDKFKSYISEKVLKRTEDTDNALKKFFKSVLQKLQEEHSEAFVSSNL